MHKQNCYFSSFCQTWSCLVIPLFKFIVVKSITISFKIIQNLWILNTNAVVRKVTQSYMDNGETSNNEKIFHFSRSMGEQSLK